MYSIKATYRRAVMIALLFLFNIQGSVIASKIQAMWVVRDDMKSPESIDRILEFAAGNNFNHIFAQVRGRGDAYYESVIVPRSHLLKGDFDPLEYILRKSQDLNINIHAWVNVYYLWSANTMPFQRNHLMYIHPQWLDNKDFRYVNVKNMLSTMRHSKGGSEEGFYLAPTHPDVEKYLLNILSELSLQYHLYGIHLDYIRYHDFDYGFNPVGVEVFKAENPDMIGASQSAIREFPLWGNFRRKAITRFVEKANQLIKINSPDCIISAAVKPNIYLARNRYGQEWDLWLSAGYLDWAVPMNYATENDVFDLNIRVMQDNIPKKYHEKIIMGVSTYNQSAISAGRKVLHAKKLNFPNICVFSFNSIMEKPGYWILLKRYFR